MTTPTLPDGRAVSACAMPTTLNGPEAALYQTIRQHHCARQNQPHDCAGRMTIDRNGLTLQCPLCGDLRKKNPADLNPAAEIKALRADRVTDKGDADGK